MKKILLPFLMCMSFQLLGMEEENIEILIQRIKKALSDYYDKKSFIDYLENNLTKDLVDDEDKLLKEVLKKFKLELKDEIDTLNKENKNKSTRNTKKKINNKLITEYKNRLEDIKNIDNHLNKKTENKKVDNVPPQNLSGSFTKNDTDDNSQKHINPLEEKDTQRKTLGEHWNNKFQQKSQNTPTKPTEVFTKNNTDNNSQRHISPLGEKEVKEKNQEKKTLRDHWNQKNQNQPQPTNPNNDLTDDKLTQKNTSPQTQRSFVDNKSTYINKENNKKRIATLKDIKDTQISTNIEALSFLGKQGSRFPRTYNDDVDKSDSDSNSNNLDEDYFSTAKKSNRSHSNENDSLTYETKNQNNNDIDESVYFQENGQWFLVNGNNEVLPVGEDVVPTAEEDEDWDQDKVNEMKNSNLDFKKTNQQWNEKVNEKIKTEKEKKEAWERNKKSGLQKTEEEVQRSKLSFDSKNTEKKLIEKTPLVIANNDQKRSPKNTKNHIVEKDEEKFIQIDLNKYVLEVAYNGDIASPIFYFKDNEFYYKVKGKEILYKSGTFFYKQDKQVFANINGYGTLVEESYDKDSLPLSKPEEHYEKAEEERYELIDGILYRIINGEKIPVEIEEDNHLDFLPPENNRHINEEQKLHNALNLPNEIKTNIKNKDLSAYLDYQKYIKAQKTGNTFTINDNGRKRSVFIKIIPENDALTYSKRFFNTTEVPVEHGKTKVEQQIERVRKEDASDYHNYIDSFYTKRKTYGKYAEQVLEDNSEEDTEGYSEDSTSEEDDDLEEKPSYHTLTITKNDVSKLIDIVDKKASKGKERVKYFYEELSISHEDIIHKIFADYIIRKKFEENFLNVYDFIDENSQLMTLLIGNIDVSSLTFAEKEQYDLCNHVSKERYLTIFMSIQDLPEAVYEEIKNLLNAIDFKIDITNLKEELKNILLTSANSKHKMFFPQEKQIEQQFIKEQNDCFSNNTLNNSTINENKYPLKLEFDEDQFKTLEEVGEDPVLLNLLERLLEQSIEEELVKIASTYEFPSIIDGPGYFVRSDTVSLKRATNDIPIPHTDVLSILKALIKCTPDHTPLNQNYAQEIGLKFYLFPWHDIDPDYEFRVFVHTDKNGIKTITALSNQHLYIANKAFGINHTEYNDIPIVKDLKQQLDNLNKKYIENSEKIKEKVKKLSEENKNMDIEKFRKELIDIETLYNIEKKKLSYRIIDYKNNLINNKDNLEKTIQTIFDYFHKNIKNKVKIDSYELDIAVLPNGKAHFIEINPGNDGTTGSSLFHHNYDFYMLYPENHGDELPIRITGT